MLWKVLMAHSSPCLPVSGCFILWFYYKFRSEVQNFRGSTCSRCCRPGHRLVSTLTPGDIDRRSILESGITRYFKLGICCCTRGIFYRPRVSVVFSNISCCWCNKYCAGYIISPVSAILLGWLLLDEILLTSHLIGMGFIAAGLLVIDGRLFKRILTSY
jgi:hypothetical protein